MIDAARLPGLRFDVVDISTWDDPGGYDLILANAVLQWVPAHDTLFPALVGRLAPAAILRADARQPRRTRAPADARVAAAGTWADKLKGAARTERFDARDYHALLSRCARGWTYGARLTTTRCAAVPARRGVVQGSALRPFLAALDDGERAAFLAQYRDALAGGRLSGARRRHRAAAVPAPVHRRDADVTRH